MAQSLSEPEFWLLLTLDADARLEELLQPIVIFEGMLKREIRGPLAIDQARTALEALFERGYVQIYEERGCGGARRRFLDATELSSVLGERSHWSKLPDTERAATYWAEITEAGEAAYRAASSARPALG